MKLKLSSLSENDQIIHRNVAGAFMIKGLALIISFFTMPAYMRFFLDHEVLGVWFTILSVLSWILSFDLGIGNGLRNKLTIALTKKDYTAAREYISSAFWLIGCIIVLLTSAGLFAIPHGNWNQLFNVDSSVVPADIMVQVVTYAFLGIMLQFFLMLISSIVYALQKSALNNLSTLMTSLLQLLFVLIAPCGTPAENLKMFSLAYIFCSNLPLLVVGIWIFTGPLKHCTPSHSCYRAEKAKSVLSLGGIFFVCQILYMIIANTNEFFISQYTGPQNVVLYQIYNRLFTLSGTLFMLALTPVWSTVSKAAAEQDFLWLKKLNQKIKLASCAAISLEFLIIPFLQIIIDIWLGEESIQVNYGHALCFALYGSAMLYQSGVSTIVNGIGRMHIQAACYAVGVLCKFMIIHIGIKLTGSWTVVVLANALILLPYCIIQQLDLNRLLNKKTLPSPETHI